MAPPILPAIPPPIPPASLSAFPNLSARENASALVAPSTIAMITRLSLVHHHNHQLVQCMPTPSCKFNSVTPLTKQTRAVRSPQPPMRPTAPAPHTGSAKRSASLSRSRGAAAPAAGSHTPNSRYLWRGPSHSTIAAQQAGGRQCSWLCKSLRRGAR